MAIPRNQRADSPQTAKTSKDVLPTPSETPKHTWMPSLFRRPTSPTPSLSSISSENSPSSEESSVRSVRFSNLVKVKYIPNLDDLSEEEKKASYMTERDYVVSCLSLENDVNCTLRKQHNQQQPNQESKSEVDSAIDPSVHFALPCNRWIRQTFHESSQSAVQMEQHHQKMQRQELKHEYGEVAAGATHPVNDEAIAAAYIPIAMQAQTMAYERALLVAMEASDHHSVTISNPDSTATE
ncbi:hypothetical protein IV203_026991 [Nitzschia inconspicua]|uniref:Uncharacterized protein n=1 Tax=Nitzschia inconspicua TaxID=303405 RepID=A0A9K3LKV5_9STRA|nr:hypothetical protein IV203_026991 [Nitzschia inconspicua]